MLAWVSLKWCSFWWSCGKTPHESAQTYSSCKLKKIKLITQACKGQPVSLGVKFLQLGFMFWHQILYLAKSNHQTRRLPVFYLFFFSLFCTSFPCLPRRRILLKLLSQKPLQVLANLAEITVWNLKCGKSVRQHRVVPCYFRPILFGKVLERCFMRPVLFLGQRSSSRISGTSANTQHEGVELLGVLWMFHISCMQMTYSQVSFFGGKK